jgi:hypothetical protein
MEDGWRCLRIMLKEGGGRGVDGLIKSINGELGSRGREEVTWM